ncbi:MAG: ABC transporter permease [Dehalococcoidia bacterium]
MQAPFRVRPRSGRLHRIWRSRTGLIGLLIVGFVIVLAAAAPVIAPHDPNDGEVIRRLRPPFWMAGGSTEFLLGTDQLGRDTLSRLIFASRPSLLVGVTAVLVAGVIGVALGLLAGYFGGFVDFVVTMLINTIIAFPFIILTLAIIAFAGRGLFNMIVVLGIAGWTFYARVLRTEVLSLRDGEFIHAAKVIGAGDGRIVWRHLLPNVTDSLLVLASLQVASMILAEAFLSYLGFGIQPPTPSWGNMLADARTYMLDRWWLAAFPGALIFLTALGINLLGDSIRDALDPRSGA